jgi:hypothetical protein
VYRYLDQASPLGIMPGYGDTVGLNSDPGQWIALMEKWATVYNDGRFKWVAHRMFEWSVARRKDMDQWGNITTATMDDLMKAYFAADDSIFEKRPEIGSLVTYRHAVNFDTSSGNYPTVLPNEIPDKLILRGGWDPNDFYALVELTPSIGHGHGDTGSVNLLTSHGSILLADTPYLVKSPESHNDFQLIADGFAIPNK